MNRKRTMVSILLACMMLMQLFVPMHSLAAENAGYERAIQVLSELEIVEGREDGSFDGDATLTRAEMATIIVRIMQMEDNEEETTIFEDVTEEHWAYYPVTTAYRAGIVKGVDETHFLPDAEVTGEQAVKMIVALLGYTVKAEAMGGYPAGYQLCATQLDILKGVGETGSGAISRKDMARLVYNALEAGMMLPEAYGEDANEYVTDADVTLLSYYMHITRYEGTVTAGYVQELIAPQRPLKKDEIAMEGTILNVGESMAADFVGESVIAYAKDLGENTLTILSAVSKSETEIVAAGDILSKTNANTFYYEKDGKEVRVSVSGVNVIYNGLPQAPTEVLLQPDTGSVKLIYTGGTLKTLMVESYENYVVSRVVKSADTVDVYENRLGTKSLIFDESKPFVLRKADNTEAKITDCKEYDILSVADSTDIGKKYRKAILTSNVITGTVTETSTNSMIIGEKEYKIAKSLLTYKEFELPELGDAAAFSLDMEGAIAGINMDAEVNMDTEANMGSNAGIQYGWLVSGEKTKGLDVFTRFKIFTATGEMKVFDTTESVKVNNTPTPSETLLTGGAGVLMDGAEVSEQLVQYRLNGEKISEINTASDFRKNYDSAARHDTFSLDAYIGKDYKLDDGTNKSGWYAFMGGNLKSFGRNWLVRSETVIFVIPGSGNDKDYIIKDPSTMTHYSDTSDIYDDLGLYDIVEDDNVISALVWDRRDEKAGNVEYPSQNVAMGVVSQNVLSMDESGETLYKLSILTQNGGSANAMVEQDFEILFGEAATDVSKDPVILANNGRPETITAKDLCPGDVIQYTLDPNKNATKISVLFRGQTPPDYEQQSSGGNRIETSIHQSYGSRVMSYGTVKKTTKYGFLSEVNLKAKGEDKKSGVSVESIMLYTNVMYEYNKNTNTVKVITKDDVEIGNDILYITRTNVPVMTIVYR